MVSFQFSSRRKRRCLVSLTTGSRPQQPPPPQPHACRPPLTPLPVARVARCYNIMSTCRKITRQILKYAYQWFERAILRCSVNLTLRVAEASQPQLQQRRRVQRVDVEGQLQSKSKYHQLTAFLLQCLVCCYSSSCSARSCQSRSRRESRVSPRFEISTFRVKFLCLPSTSRKGNTVKNSFFFLLHQQ